MRYIILLCSGILFCISCCLNKPLQNNRKSDVVLSSDWLGTLAQEYYGPQIVRLAWGSIPKNFISDERFQELKESGITHNVNWFSSTEDETERELDIAQKAGVKIIIHSQELPSDPKKIITRFKDHPALAGYYLGDEPKSPLFTQYGELAEKIRTFDNTHYCYVNLPRITHFDPNFGRGTENYKAYMNDFLSKIKPDFLSYDNYTIYYPKDSKELMVDPHMFENLEVIRDAALKANLDFWAFCLTSSHTVGKGAKFRLYPVPSLGHMRLYVYSDLAYGAQGIEYFTYWQAGPDTVTNSYGDYFLTAPINFDGKRTPVYDSLKIINTEIKNLSFVFADAKVKWVRHTGNTIPEGTTKLDTELEKTPFKDLQASGGLIVSLLEKADNSYLILVNRDCSNSVDLTIELKPGVKRVLKSGAVIKPEKNLKITEGDVAIYTWK